MNVTITYEDNWRATYWDADVPSRRAWFVTCADHPDVGKDSHGELWGYAEAGRARGVRTRHIDTMHKGEI